jgi:hypothetical protein
LSVKPWLQQLSPMRGARLRELKARAFLRLGNSVRQ